jgi:hypothetical protein
MLIIASITTPAVVDRFGVIAAVPDYLAIVIP